MRLFSRRRNRIILYVVIALFLLIFLPSIILKLYINSEGFRKKVYDAINQRLRFENLFISYELGDIGLISGIEFRYIRAAEKERVIANLEGCRIRDIYKKLVYGRNAFTLRCEKGEFDLNYLEGMKGSSGITSATTYVSKPDIRFYIESCLAKYKKYRAEFSLSGRYAGGDSFIEVELRDRYRIRISNLNPVRKSAIVTFSDIDIPFILKNYLLKYSELVDGKLDGSIQVMKSKNELIAEFQNVTVKNMSIRHPLIQDRPFRIKRFFVNGKVSLSLVSNLLRIEESEVDLSNIIFFISGRFYKGSYAINFTTKRAALNDLVAFFDGEEFEGFDMSGEIRAKVSVSGNLNSEKKIDRIDISGEVINPEQISRRLDYLKGDFTYDFTDRNGKRRKVVVGSNNPDYVPFERIPVYVYGAVVSSEDAGFFSHKGVEFKEIESAIIDNIQNDKPYLRGGSTITQQLAKNLFLTKEKTLLRKAKELLLSIELDAALSKQRILEIYLNGIEWGPNIFGIGMASRHYFGKSVEDLRPIEAAYLASIIPNPNRYYTYYLKNEVPDKWYEKIQNILYKMNLFGFLKDEEYNASLSDKILFERNITTDTR